MSKNEEVATYSWKNILLFNAVVLAVVCALFYVFYPQGVRQVLFVGLMQHGWYILPCAGVLWIAYKYLRTYGEDVFNCPRDHRRPIAVFVTLCVMTVIWCLFVHNTADYATYVLYASKFASRDSLVATAPECVRYTPFANAATDLGNSISATGEHVESAYVQPIVSKHCFGYIAPITPSGILNTFMMKNPGFKYLDDSFAVDNEPEKRIIRIDEEQQVGLGMEWMDNLWLVLAHTDLFATYDTPHYLALDPAKPSKLTMVVPKIKYSMLWQLPYWGGDTIVHNDGTVEDLTAEQIKADPRFKGQWVFPMALARKYVELQSYGCGWYILTPMVRVAGKLEVEKLEGENQFPMLMYGADDHTYLVTTTKGEGSARGLFRVYYANASTGEMTYHEFKSNEVVYGAGAALDRMVNIPGYQWYHKGEGHNDTASGTMIRTEPVYIVRPHDSRLYWKATITNLNHTGVSATVVADASRPDDVLVFSKRAEFEAWLHGKDGALTPKSASATVAKAGQAGISESLRKELIDEIGALSAQVSRLRQKVELIPVKR